MTSLRSALRRCRAAVLANQDTPHRAALALSAGVFLSFSPLLGFQIALGALLGWALRFNKVLLFVGLCTNLPWLAPAYYAATTEAAAWVLGYPAPSQLVGRFGALFERSILGSQFWMELLLLVRPLFWPFMVGSMVAAGALALLAYALGFALASHRPDQGTEH